MCWWVFWHQDASCSDAGGVPGIGAVPFDYVHSPRQTGRIQMPWMSQNVAFLSSAAGAFRAWDRDRGRSRIRQIRHLTKGLRAWKTKRDQGGRREFKKIQGFLLIWFYPRENARNQDPAVGQKEGASGYTTVVRKGHGGRAKLDATAPAGEQDVGSTVIQLTPNQAVRPDGTRTAPSPRHEGHRPGHR